MDTDFVISDNCCFKFSLCSSQFHRSCGIVFKAKSSLQIWLAFTCLLFQVLSCSNDDSTLYLNHRNRSGVDLQCLAFYSRFFCSFVKLKCNLQNIEHKELNKNSFSYLTDILFTINSIRWLIIELETFKRCFFSFTVRNLVLNINSVKCSVSPKWHPWYKMEREEIRRPMRW